MKVRIITPDGVISKDVYDQESNETDSKGRVQIIDSDGNELPVHKQRVVPEDSFEKAVVIAKGDKLLGFCPVCRYSAEPQDNGKFVCPDHGVFDTVGETVVKPIRSGSKKKSKRPAKEAKKVSDQETKVRDAKKAAAKVDFGEVKKHGELWTKARIPFDHAKVDVQAHTIIADDPLRKLCFNTYNGSLGKKSREPIAELQLERFASNDSDGNGKTIGYTVKGTAESLREKLEKDGFTKQ